MAGKFRLLTWHLLLALPRSSIRRELSLSLTSWLAPAGILTVPSQQTAPKNGLGEDARKLNLSSRLCPSRTI
jgi:hypothetical protein